MINRLLNGEYNKILSTVYCTDALKYQINRYVNAIKNFESLYGTKEISIFSAPGRTEIGGNHTDHQKGRIIAASVNLDTIAVVAKRDDETINLVSEGHGKTTVSLCDLFLDENQKGKTIALVKGVAAAFKKRGYNVGGFDAYVTSDVLSGSGLSSSAAFEVLLGNILSGLYNNNIDAVTIAKIGQEAENVYFGKPCGLLDQMASSVGGMIYVDFYDSNNLVIKKINVDFNSFNHTLCITDTKGSHADLTDEYAAIPYEMKSVAKHFGKEYLSEISADDFINNIPAVREKCGDRAVLRALHFFNENARVLKQVDALENNNFDEFKELVNASGNSSYKHLQNVYSNKKINEQSVSLALALSDNILGDKGVCRVHGGGFAGTIQAIVPNELVDDYKQRIESVYGENSCYKLSIRPVGGIQIL